MEQMATIGLDITKSVFQVHGIVKRGSVVVQRRSRRSQVLAFFSKQSPCVVGLKPVRVRIFGLVRSVH
jgi:transposase